MKDRVTLIEELRNLQVEKGSYEWPNNTLYTGFNELQCGWERYRLGEIKKRIEQIYSELKQ